MIDLKISYSPVFYTHFKAMHTATVLRKKAPISKSQVESDVAGRPAGMNI